MPPEKPPTSQRSATKKRPAGLRRPRVERDWATTFQLLVAMAQGGASMEAAVRNALLDLFRRWPDAQALAAAPAGSVERVLRPLGQAKRRAEAVIAVARAVAEGPSADVPDSVDAIAALPGVSRTVANVVVRRAHGAISGAAPVVEVDPPPDSRVDASRLPPDWEEAIGPALAGLDVPGVLTRVAGERATGAVFPPASDVFAALHHTPFAKTRVVILGQDPYPTPGLANGLAFSVRRGLKLPPSLVNMFHEMVADVGAPFPTHGDLLAWARQGVLLLNTLLTVRASEPQSHKLFGWRELTDAILSALDRRAEHVVFVLWGGQARAKLKLFTSGRHTVIEGAHPSPMSVKAFQGSRPYSRINAALRAHGQPEIDWALG